MFRAVTQVTNLYLYQQLQNTSQLPMFRAITQVTNLYLYQQLQNPLVDTTFYQTSADGGTNCVVLRCVTIAVSTQAATIKTQQHHEENKRISLIVGVTLMERWRENYVTNVLLFCTGIAVSTRENCSVTSQ
jgi:hypothetical protein